MRITKSMFAEENSYIKHKQNTHKTIKYTKPNVIDSLLGFNNSKCTFLIFIIINYCGVILFSCLILPIG